MSNYVYLSATELAGMIQRREATSAAIVEDHLEHARKHNPQLNAFVMLLESEALEQAALCDRDTEAGIARGALHGVPISIKEQFWVAGTKSTVNSNAFKNWTAQNDALTVRSLREAGAVILGKTNEAFYWFEYMLQQIPNNIEKRLRVVDIYAMIGDWSKAEQHLIICGKQK